MAWTAPMTAVTGAMLTAAQWNTQVRDNLLETGPAKVSASGQLLVSNGPNSIIARQPVSGFVADSDNTSNTSFGDLNITNGPTVTVQTGANALVFFAATLAQTTVNMYAIASYEVFGATSISANTQNSLNFRCGIANQQFRASACDWLTTLTPGENNFSMKYMAGSGGTAVFATRSIFVIPF